jgi:BirA family transcriptional regulator, biotin operon repressor / biotin---[acetyl-CoA-carboxylase] ligase
MFPGKTSDQLDAQQLQAQLSGALIGRQVVLLEQTNSTNDAILELATSSLIEGLVLFAEYQTAGRGQRGNRWESAAGKGLWFSTLLRPGMQVRESGRLTLWAMEAISNAIQMEFGLESAIKLPNDVQLEGRKVAGVLVEMRAQEKAPHVAIVGIGINANQSLDDFPLELRPRAISLAMALNRRIDRQKFAVALLRHLARTYRKIFASAS